MKYVKSIASYAQRHGPGIAKTAWREVGKPLVIHAAKTALMAALV